jgi:pyruvate dehydrogenase E2 component (dihydrolipoamide acetyltransferase)
MATTIVMEALSPTMEEGRLVKWAKKEGDPVKAGDTLAEVETDKAVMELVARADGALIKIVVPEGQTVPVGNVVGYIGAVGEKIDGAVSPQPSAVSPQPSAPPAPPAPALAKPAPAAPPSVVATSDRLPTPDSRIKASPLAKKIAVDSGVDLRSVVGSGPGGRVIKKDLEGRESGVVRAAAVEAPLVGSRRLPTPDSPYEDIPLTQIRKTIAKRLVTSIGPIPHFFLTTEVDMERAAEAREAINKQLGDQGKISFNDIVIKATALALAKHRACNAWFQDDHIRYWNEVHIGMAVAVPDGLITPVVRNADLKSMLAIGQEAKVLAQKARDRKLQPNEYTGATFSVSNLGMFDIDQFTAVINPPEAGILAVGSIVQKPVVEDGKIEARRRLRLTMSCDHRVIDGATGAAFLKTLKQMLENPLAMVL